MGESTEDTLPYARRGEGKRQCTRIKRAHTHIEASAHESAQNVSSCTKRGGEASVLLCVGVSHFFTMIYERVHECLTM